MPNWCSNVVTFKHRDPKLIKRLVAGFNKGGMMEEFFPCPKELADTMSGSHPKGSPEALEHELQQKVNEKIHGYRNWYDWQCAHWGTKWDVGKRDYTDAIDVKRGAKEITISFESAWSPPTPFFEKMCQQQQFSIHAKYFEPGCGFIGRWQDGVEETYSFDDTNAEWLEENVPEDLLDEFGVLDFFASEELDEEEEA